VLRPAPSGGIERFDGPYAFIADVAVTSDARGQGIGRSLMDDVATWAHGRGACALTLSDHTQNPATHLYRELGYQPTWQTYRKDL
jgi:GNAT superfamily N-acetyltransferase